MIEFSMTDEANMSGSQPEVVPSPTDAAATPATPDQDPNVTASGEKLDRQTRNWRALEKDRDHWREMAMRQPTTPQQPLATTPEPARVDPLKGLADFEYDEAKYQQYLHGELRTSLSAETRAAVKAELAAEREREDSARRRSTFQSRASEFAKTISDYDDVVRNPSLPITPDMAEVIQDSDDGPALVYHLGKNPDIAEKIAQLPPKAAARELGKIEARLAFEREKAKAEKVSKAPPPPPKVEGTEPAIGNVKADDPDSDKLSDEEWTRRRNKQVERRRSN